MSNSKQNIALKEQVSHYPFGMPMPGSSYTSESYRFGYNTQEKVDEVAGAGNHYTAEFWEYSPRVVHRWNTDPVVKEWESPYAINLGNPILFHDPLGDDGKVTTDDSGKTTYSGEVMDKSGKVKVVQGYDNEQLKQKGFTVLQGTGTEDGGLNKAKEILGVPENYNKNSKYKYDAKDLKVRVFLENKNNGLWRFVNKLENEGNAIPLNQQNEYKRYVNKWHTNSSWIYAVQEGYFDPSAALSGELLATSQSISRMKYIRYNNRASVKTQLKTKRAETLLNSNKNIKNPWNRFQHNAKKANTPASSINYHHLKKIAN